MEKMKKYDIFLEDKIYENFLEGMVDRVIGFFRNKFKKASWLYYALFLKKKGQLPPNKVEVFPWGSSPSLNQIPTEQELGLQTEHYSMYYEAKGGTEEASERVPLEHPDPEIRNIDGDELKELITDHFRLKGEYPDEQFSLFVWGAPGVAKTAIIKETAKKLGVDLIVWHLSTIEPTDFIGLPQIKQNKAGQDRTYFALPAIFPSDNGAKDKGGIMFFDELNRANNMVLSASLQLCLDGKVGDYQLPTKWLIIAAGNRKEEVMDVTELEPALANRFSHVNLVLSLNVWTEWALTQSHMHGDVLAFLDFNKDFFHYLEKDPDKQSETWPSPRSWEKASKFYTSELKAKGGHLSREKIIAIFAKEIGSKAALAFSGYLDLKDKFNEKDVKEVYEKGAAYKKDLPTRPDQSRAACASIAFYKKNTKISVDDMKNVLDFAMAIKDFEVATSLISYFRRVHPYIKDEMPWKDEYAKYVKKWHNEHYQKLLAD